MALLPGNRLAAEGLAWAPTAGNLAALLCLALCLALNSSLTQARPVTYVLCQFHCRPSMVSAISPVLTDVDI